MNYKFAPSVRQILAAAIVATLAAGAGAQSLFDAKTFRPLTADSKAFRPGDIVTIQIVENASASANADTDLKRSNSAGAELHFRAALPIAGANATATGQFDGGGQTARTGQLLATISVSVRDVLPNGDLLVAGEQLLVINEEQQRIDVEGRVRPQDISDTNAVLSNRVADARITYVGEGDLANRQKPGWWHHFSISSDYDPPSRTLLAALAFVALGANAAIATPAPLHDGSELIRMKDLGKIQGWRENALIGYGIVSGLAGTGDSPTNRTTRQALANTLSQFNLTIPTDQVQSRNVAVVMVTASLPAFAREGDAIDITVTSSGDARSLVGGSLLMTPLKAANGHVYALAQGALSVGGYRYDANGNVVQKNHPTVGSVPGGATVEASVPKVEQPLPETLTFVLQEADYTTANRVAEAINAQFGEALAQARDASGIDIRVPVADRGRLVRFIAQLESVNVEPDRRAKVVINERTGTIVSGGDVRISRIAVSQGDLRVSISTDNSVSQPLVVGRGGAGVRTELVANSTVDVNESTGAGFVTANNTVADLVQSLSRLKTNTRDIISILRAVKAAGALHAELIVQ